jgi:predicted DNA-binding transcriptional regulator YafY
MSFIKKLERIERIDQLIKLRATGTPEELASKLAISESSLYDTLSTMKDLGAPIEYDKYLETYYYSQCVMVDFTFRKVNHN